MPKAPEFANDIFSDCLSVIYAEYSQAAKLPERRIPTGFSIFDNALRKSPEGEGGLRYPSLVVIGAQPKIGKSLLVTEIARNWIEDGGFAIYNDLENGRERFIRRLCMRNTGLTEHQICQAHMYGESSDVQARWKKSDRWVENFGGQMIYKDRPGSEEDYVNWVRAVKSKAASRPVLLAIDSLHKLPTHGERRHGIDRWVKFFEQLRGAEGIIVILVSELSRAGPGKVGYVAHGTAYKESGEIEYTADLALTLFERERNTGRKAFGMMIEWNRDGEAAGAVPAVYQIINGQIIEHNDMEAKQMAEEIERAKERCKAQKESQS